jgi:hypothetical protein
VALSPQANSTDWATATCWRNLVQAFADRGVSRGQRDGSRTVVNLSFIDRVFISQKTELFIVTAVNTSNFVLLKGIFECNFDILLPLFVIWILSST